MVKCPVCDELLNELTSVHCQRSHGLSKQQVIEEYGKPPSLFHTFIDKRNNVGEYIPRKRDFLNSQLFNDRVRSKTRKFRCDR